jgi:hypothetical protein
MGSMIFLGLLLLALILAPTPSPAQNLDPLTRSKIDRELAAATGVGSLLHVANKYAVAGYVQEAKAVVDRAALKAHSAMEWQAVAGAYQRLGYKESAEMAKKKAREASK